MINEFGNTFFISGNKISLAYLSISWVTKSASFFTTGLVSHSTLHLSAITLWAIPPLIPPTDKVECGGSNMQSFGPLCFRLSLISKSLFTYLDAYSTALTPKWGLELWPASPPKCTVYSFIPLWASMIFIFVGSPIIQIPSLISLFFNSLINKGAPIQAVSSSNV